MKDNTAYSKGIEGEDKALKYCQSQGMNLVARRYKTLYGEIDLIMEDKGTLAFVEVKWRKTGHEGDGLMALTIQKRKKLILAAMEYIQLNNIDSPVRMDAVEITKDGINYIQNAF